MVTGIPSNRELCVTDESNPPCRTLRRPEERAVRPLVAVAETNSPAQHMRARSVPRVVAIDIVIGATTRSLWSPVRVVDASSHRRIRGRDSVTHVVELGLGRRRNGRSKTKDADHSQDANKQRRTDAPSNDSGVQNKVSSLRLTIASKLASLKS